MTKKKASGDAKSSPKKNNDTVSMKDSTVWKMVSGVLFILLVVAVILNFSAKPESQMNSADEVKTKTLDFVNTNLLQPGTQASVASIEEVNGLYKITLSVQDQQIVSYSSPDGEIFFPQGLVLEEVETPPAGEQEVAPPAANVPKSETPKVELFVMSHCPYGTQIEKGMLPVVELLGDKMDLEIKFVNYAMHGEKEVNEQLNQYCIQKEYPNQYFKYLQCFLGSEDSETCKAELDFDQDTLDTCIAAADEEFGVSNDLEDESTWAGGRFPRFGVHNEENVEYGVQGSPTLVINGQSVSSARDSESLKNLICGSFENAPEECNNVLPSASPSPGFGFGTTGTDSAAANCGV